MCKRDLFCNAFRKLLAAILFTGFSFLIAVRAQEKPGDPIVLVRHYHEGEKLAYRMSGVNESEKYEIQADGIVKKDASGAYYEEYGWSNLVSNEQTGAFSPASLNFRQQVSLDPGRNPSIPDLGKIDPKLIGPITDLLTFYVDAWLAIKTGQPKHVGDHFRFPRATPNSWADGSYVLIGEEVIDFDLSFKEYNATAQTVTLVVRHVPPERPELKLPAEWMRKNVADSRNNWVEVRKTGQGKYLAAVGKETFDVEMKVDLRDGKILSGTLDNTVQTIQRECDDAPPSKCGDPKPHLIRRKVEITLK